MKIINGQHPPNIDAIDARFHVRDKANILYCYGDAIYNPTGVKISDHIYAHETVHSFRQGTDPDTWWGNYIQNHKFRLAEEIVAHRIEWGQFCKDNTDRNEQARYLHFMCQRLAGSLYDNLLTVKEARQRIIMS